MKSKNMVMLLGMGLVIAGFVSMAVADDFDPPSWRGLPGTTMQQWEFSTDNARDGVPPDISNNPYGIPILDMNPTLWPPEPSNPPGFEWADEFLGRQGVYSLSGSFDIVVPNHPVLNNEKRIWLQLTWYEQFPINIAEWIGERLLPDEGIYISDSDPPATSKTARLVSDELVQPPVFDPWTSLPSNWHHTVVELTMTPNPFVETIHVRAPIYIDEVVVDTICVPEPSTFALIVLGVLGLLAFRVKRIFVRG